MSHNGYMTCPSRFPLPSPVGYSRECLCLPDLYCLYLGREDSPLGGFSFPHSILTLSPLVESLNNLCRLLLVFAVGPLGRYINQSGYIWALAKESHEC